MAKCCLSRKIYRTNLTQIEFFFYFSILDSFRSHILNIIYNKNICIDKKMRMFMKSHHPECLHTYSHTHRTNRL